MPPLRDPAAATPADFAFCRDALRRGSRSFLAASLLLPARVRAPAAALYAFCREADDAVDLACVPDLAPLRDRLDRAYAGRPRPGPVDRAFAEVVARFAIPRALFDALLEGFAWDAEGRRYEDFADLGAYAARVAGSVGAMMAVLMGVRAPEKLARACDLGTAMQLTNIARDIGEDARAGRLYLPLSWLREAGISPQDWLARPVFDPALAAVVRRLLGEAEALYARADAGIAGLPRSCRPAIRAARRLYAAIGDEVARPGFDPVARRASVPPGRKAWLLARALAGGAGTPAHAMAPPLEAARFLVAAVDCAPLAMIPRRRPIWRRIDDRIAWIAELFAQLEQRQALGDGHSARLRH